ncbi:hypothetical protein RFI_18822, partial [Reticulomyxa filosa]
RAQAYANIAAAQGKVANSHMQSKEAKEQYIGAVKKNREFRMEFDSNVAAVLDQLEHTEVERAKIFHKLLHVYLEIQIDMFTHCLKNIETIKTNISKLDAQADNREFVEKYRPMQEKPPLPEPQLCADDIGINLFATLIWEQRQSPFFFFFFLFDLTKEKENFEMSELCEDTPDVKKWCTKWRLVISKILGRDPEMSVSLIKTEGDLFSTTINPNNTNNDGNGGNGNGNDNGSGGSSNSSISSTKHKRSSTISSQLIQLTDQDFEKLKIQCLESLNSPEGRMAFAILLNRQRMLIMVFFFLIFFVIDQNTCLLNWQGSWKSFATVCKKHQPIDVKPAKLVMIMTQSLYVRKENITNGLSSEEKLQTQITNNEADHSTNMQLFKLISFVHLNSLKGERRVFKSSLPNNNRENVTNVMVPMNEQKDTSEIETKENNA